MVEDEDLRKRLKALGYDMGGWVYDFPREGANFLQLQYEIEAATGFCFFAVDGHASYDGSTYQITSRRRLTPEEISAIEEVVKNHVPAELYTYTFRKKITHPKILNQSILISLHSKEELTKEEVAELAAVLEAEHLKTQFS